MMQEDCENIDENAGEERAGAGLYQHEYVTGRDRWALKQVHMAEEVTLLLEDTCSME